MVRKDQYRMVGIWKLEGGASVTCTIKPIIKVQGFVIV